MNEPSPFPRPIGAIAIVMGAWLLTGFGILALGPPGESGFSIGKLGIAEAFGFGLVGTLAARFVPDPQGERLGMRGLDPRFYGMLLLLVPLPIVISELTNIAQSFFPAPDVPDGVALARERLGLTTPLGLFEATLVIVGLMPVVEEWLYRGVIQQGLVGHLGRLYGLLLTSALFGLAHFQPSTSVASSLATFAATLPLGLLLGGLRLATGSLLAPILVHACSNALQLGALVGAESFAIPGFNSEGDHTPMSWILPSLLAVGLGARQVFLGARDAAPYLSAESPPDSPGDFGAPDERHPDPGEPDPDSRKDADERTGRPPDGDR